MDAIHMSVEELADWRVSIHAPVMDAMIHDKSKNLGNAVSIHAPVMDAIFALR